MPGLKAYKPPTSLWGKPTVLTFTARPGVRPHDRNEAYLLRYSLHLLHHGVPLPHYAVESYKCWEINEAGEVLLVVGGDM